MNHLMRQFVLGCLCIGLLSVLNIQADALTLYVAANGNDAWSGGLVEPNAAQSDGPLATIAGARDALRALKAQGTLSEAVKVVIRGGEYFITEPIVFTGEDSGTKETPIQYEAHPGEVPVIHGGQALTGWRQEGALFVADIPENLAFSALWVNGQRRQPARTPNAAHPFGDYPPDSDFLYTEGPVKEKDPASGKEANSATKFQYKPGDLKPWVNLEDALVVIFHSWATSSLRIKALDEEKRIVEFTGPARWPFAYWIKNQWYFVENVFEALDAPGEWYLNRNTGKVYYMPMPGETPDNIQAVIPIAKQLIRLDGKPAEGKFVEFLNFRGLKMHYTEYTIAPEGISDAQAAYTLPAAFEATGARHCTVDRCEIAHAGTYGLWFRAGCQYNSLTHSEITDMGAGGVRIGEGGNPASENEAALWNVVDNNFLHDGGLMFREAVGVWMGRTSYNRLSHNEICDFRYSGISIGWSWGYQESSANHNIIEFNNVHDVGKGQLSDMGAIYTLGISPGTVIQNNYFHDVYSNPKVSGGWGIYFDEGSTDILATNNIVCNTLTGTLHQHYGRDNRVQNNIFAFSHREQLIRSRQEEHISFFFERNIVLFNNGKLLGSNWSNGNFRNFQNCYWDTSNAPIAFAGKTLEQWQAEGQDVHSVIADPMFENVEARDFRLKPDSPAIQLGFQPIDISRAGLYGDEEWVNKPKTIERIPAPMPSAL